MFNFVRLTFEWNKCLYEKGKVSDRRRANISRSSKLADATKALFVGKLVIRARKIISISDST